MLLTLLALLLGAGLGFVELARRGALDLTGWRPWSCIEQPWIVGGGIVLQASAETFDLPFRRSVLVIGLFALVVGLAGNLFRLSGAGVTIVGLVANLLALVANGHVPVRLEALIGAGVVDAAADPSDMVINGGLAQLESDATRLGFLGDIVPIPFLGDVVSFGDLIVLAGILLMARAVMLSAQSSRRRPRRATRRALLDLDLDPPVPTAAEEAPVEQLPVERLSVERLSVERLSVDDLLAEDVFAKASTPAPAPAPVPEVGEADEGLVSVRRRPAPAATTTAGIEPDDGIDVDEGIDVDDFLIDLREARLIPEPEEAQPAQTMSVDELLGPDPSADSRTPTTRS